MKKIFYFLVAGMITASTGNANNIQLSNVSIINNGPGSIQVQFDISWENSWRVNVGPNNYDGAWVFFKYKTASGNWTQLTMTGNDNVLPGGVDVHQNNEFQRTGAIIYRESGNPGVGTFTVTGVRLGVINTLPYDIDVKGFAVEMVYIPAPTSRSFFGDGNGVIESTNAFHYYDNTATNLSVVPMKCDANVFDDAVIEGGGVYIYSNDTIQQASPLGSLDPFPTMKALWCMKYEISQAAYRDFLNTLTYDQQETRTANAPNSATGTGALTASGTARSWLEIKTPGSNNAVPAVYGCDADGDNTYDESTDGEWDACGFLTWTDVAAYLDWSGMAPMSEFQFERICRGHSSSGPQPAIYGEYAWGASTIISSGYIVTGSGTAAETVSNPSSNGNAMYATTSPGGPVRNGIFASAVSNRIISGAAFFGVMEMSGNVEEYVITVGTTAGRSVRFVPNGNGSLAENGNARLTVGGAGFWPGMEGNNSSTIENECSLGCEVTGNAGIVTKGGSYGHAVSSLSIATRTYSTPNSTRLGYRGGRGVLYIR